MSFHRRNTALLLIYTRSALYIFEINAGGGNMAITRGNLVFNTVRFIYLSSISRVRARTSRAALLSGRLFDRN